MSAFID